MQNPKDIQVWWHDQFDANATTAVADNKVRRSTVYDLKVATVANQDASHNPFVYMTIPRGGKAKQDYSDNDGAEFAESAKLTMSWSSFLYKKDVWLQIDIKDGNTIASVDEVVIRPLRLHFAKELLSPTSVRIKIPYSEAGYRFSVEIASGLMTARSNQLGTSGWLTENVQDAEVHTAPRNALMIFAEPMLNDAQRDALVPSSASGTIFYPEPGTINLNSVAQQIIYFKPGIYTMPENYHAKLPENVEWVYLAPGAYVKGAFEFDSAAASNKLTGFGVLSGEKYVYAPDRKKGYAHSPKQCDGDCLRLLQFAAKSNQTLNVHGITLNEPPFNSFSVFGNLDSYPTHIANYKQVGGWYYQTDGVEVYRGGSIKNAFFHSNDDVLKMYHSNTTAENIVIWKGENGPAIQFGWASRTISDMLVKDVDVIHNLMYWKDQKSNTCIINSTDLYSETPQEKDRISLSHSIQNVEFNNIRAEGKNLCAMRFIALSNWQSIHINGLEIEAWNDLATDSQLSLFRARSTAENPPQQVAIGVGAQGLHIENYTVGGNPIVKSDESWRSNANGRLNFNGDLSNNWSATSSKTPSCIAQTINFPKPADMFTASLATLSASASSGLPITFSRLGGEGTIVGNSLTTSANAGLVTIAAEAGNDIYCATKIVQLLNVVYADTVLAKGRWIGASWSAWSPSAIPMVWDATEKLFKAKVTLTTGNKELKFLDSTNWSDDDWGNASGLSGIAAKTTGGGANISFVVALAGSYMIKFNPYSLAYSIAPD